MSQQPTIRTDQALFAFQQQEDKKDQSMMHGGCDMQCDNCPCKEEKKADGQAAFTSNPNQTYES